MNTNEDTVQYSYQTGCALKIDTPARYRIRVLGEVAESWSDRLGGMEIVTTGQRNQGMITTLSGPVLDQAALFGVLKALYDMRLPLLSVEYLEVT